MDIYEFLPAKTIMDDAETQGFISDVGERKNENQTLGDRAVTRVETRSPSVLLHHHQLRHRHHRLHHPHQIHQNLRLHLGNP